MFAFVESQEPSDAFDHLPQRSMQILDALNEALEKSQGVKAPSNDEILAWALSTATEAVIMKQHSSANPIAKPSWQIQGNLVHYDIFKL